MQPTDLVPLVGHARLQARLTAAAASGSLPASLLLHGPAGVGKQRLALWLAQSLLCTAECPTGERASRAPCGACQGCHFAAALTHPDLRWVFPRPRSKDPDPTAADVIREYADAIADRVRDGLLYSTPSGADGIYIATVRALVHDAALTPAFGSRKVFVVGDADRMVAQEGAEVAANAFLKLLEEPPADTTIILTSSAPGTLLPTIRSRVVAIQVTPLPHEDMATWVSHPRVRAALDAGGLPDGDDRRVRAAHGAPGWLLGVAARRSAMAAARALIDAARARQPATRYSLALRQGSVGARGAFADTLDAMTEILHSDIRAALDRDDPSAARAACAAIGSLEDAKGRAEGNANPQLVAASLLHDLSTTLRIGH